jgi:Bacterial protein of unknown function (DUF937)
MASLLESLTESLSPDIVGQLGKAVGLDGPTTTKGLDVVGPLLTSAMANTASSPQGLDSLMGMVSQIGGSSTPGDLMKMVTGGAGTPMLSGLFGSGLSAVSGTLDRALGFKVSPLIGLVAPFLISQIGQRMSGGALDKAGVARLLQDEQKRVTSMGGPTGQLVQQALAAGREATATIAKYSPDQWSKVRLGPIAAAGLVITASPSGLMGTTKEVVALADAVAALKENTAPTSIFNLVAEKQVTAEELKSLPTDRGALTALVRESVAAVESNNPGEAASYGQFLVDLVTKVAEASKEGGFLGIGGTRISEAEHAAIDQVKAAVGLRARTAT